MSDSFETSRLIIRDYEPTDLESIHAYVSQPIVVKYAFWGPNTWEDTKQFLNEVQYRKEQTPRFVYEFAIELKKDGRQIGGCEIAISEGPSPVATLGYIINPAYWNQGYATEVTRKLVDFALTELKAKTIRATCDERNKSSRRVLEKIGFAIDKIIENDFLQKGEVRTTLVFTYVQ